MDFSEELEALRSANEKAEAEQPDTVRELPVEDSGSDGMNQEALNEYAKAKAQSETAEIASIAKKSNEVVATKLNQELVDYIGKSEDVKQKIEHTASGIVDDGLKSQSNLVKADATRSEDEVIKADFEKNQSEYLYHGIDHKIDKRWKSFILLRMNDFWFVVWSIISFFTIVPVSMFLSRIRALKGLVKVVAVIVGVLLACAVLAVVLYFLITWLVSL